MFKVKAFTVGYILDIRTKIRPRGINVKLILCQTPDAAKACEAPEIPSAQLTCSRGNKQNSVCSYKCNAGYTKANGNAKLKCRCKKGKCGWSGLKNARCERGMSDFRYTLLSRI